MVVDPHQVVLLRHPGPDCQDFCAQAAEAENHPQKHMCLPELRQFMESIITMVIEIKEYNYKGFHLILNKNSGWKCVIGEQEILFPHSQAAETAIDEILKDATNIIARNKGVAIGKSPRSQVTKTVVQKKAY